MLHKLRHLFGVHHWVYAPKRNALGLAVTPAQRGDYRECSVCGRKESYAWQRGWLTDKEWTTIP